MGLERMAMFLYDIPDIRLFWTEDDWFLSQFKSNEITQFIPFSKYPSCFKDISFYVPEDYQENEFFDLVREIGGDLIDQVAKIDQFLNKKSGRMSYCYWVVY